MTDVFPTPWSPRNTSLYFARGEILGAAPVDTAWLICSPVEAGADDVAMIIWSFYNVYSANSARKLTATSYARFSFLHESNKTEPWPVFQKDYADNWSDSLLLLQTLHDTSSQRLNSNIHTSYSNWFQFPVSQNGKSSHSFVQCDSFDSPVRKIISIWDLGTRTQDPNSFAFWLFWCFGPRVKYLLARMRTLRGTYLPQRCPHSTLTSADEEE